MLIRRRGIEKRFMIDDGAAATSTVDPVLLKAVARAHCWFAEVLAGRSMVEIAMRERVGKQYVSRLMRLAFLAPEMVEQIVAGRQPRELTAQTLLTNATELPLSWESQKRLLGFAQLA